MKKPRPVKHPSMSSIFDSDSPRKRKINQSSPPHISLVRDEAASGQRVPGMAVIGGSRTTLHPREQKRKLSRRLRQQISQVFVTPFPCLGWGLLFKNTILVLFMTYVWMHDISMNLDTSDTLITLWYDDLRIDDG